MNIEKKNNFKLTLLAIAIVAAILALALCVYFQKSEKSTQSTAFPSENVVVIDAGHGGIDNGATANGAVEAEINLEISQKLAAAISNLGIIAVETRTGDYGLYGDTSPGFKLRDLKARLEIAKNANATMIISIHQNASAIPDRTGIVIYYDENCETSKLLANAIATNFENCSVRTGDFYITREADVPCVLIECGFITTTKEAALLSSEEYQNEIAAAIKAGVVCFLLQNG